MAGLISLGGTVLSSLHTSLGFAQTAEKHKAAGESYRAIRRRFEMFQLRCAETTSEQRRAAMTDLEKIVAGLADIPKDFPTVPQGLLRQSG